MAINFPSSPSLDQIYQAGARQWIWNGRFWQSTSPFENPGYTGSAGADGAAGYTGSRGADGTAVQIVGSVSTASLLPLPYTGATGDGYIVTDTNYLYVWDGAQWIEIGQITGYTGSMGYTGSEGLQGIQGYTGSVGYVGSQGAGFTGSGGGPGFTGSRGYSGSAGPAGESSYIYSEFEPVSPQPGDRWFNTNYGVELVWTLDGDSGQWIEISASGYLGQTGYSGSIGYTGSPGEFAALGYTGSSGTTGFTGSEGPVGDQGAKGDIGYVGSKGDSGNTGYVGSRGYNGSQGNRSGIQYLYDPTVTAEGIPNGRVRFNSTETSVVGEIYISKFDIYGSNNENYMISWDDSNNPSNKGYISFKKNFNVSTATLIYSIIDPISDQVDYLIFPVSYSSGSFAGFDGGDQITVEHSRTGDLGYSGSQGYTGSLGGFSSIQTINLQTGTTYTLAGSDAGLLVELNNTSGTTVTVPEESVVNFVIGQRIDLQQLTTGPVIVTAAPGVVLNTAESPILNNQFSIGTLIKTGSNEWSFVAPAALGYTGSQGLVGFTGSFGITGFTGSAGVVTSASALVLTSSTLTTAVTGSLEWDGRVPYFTPQGLQRGVVPGMQYFRLNAGRVGANATGAQSTLGVGVTLSSSTVYAFELVFGMIKTAGTTSHTVGINFGGTVTLNNIGYIVHESDGNGTAGTRVAVLGTTFINNTTTNTVVSPALTAATQVNTIRAVGSVSINAGGTFIPQYTLSAAPGGAYTIQPGSYMMIYPIGVATTNTSVGTWA